MNNIILQKTWVQGRPVAVDNLLGTAFTGEAGAHTFIIKGVDAADQPVQISGDITGRLLASNNVTVPLTGTIENGCAVVTLTQDCYYVPGKFIFSVYSTDGDVTSCLYCAVGNIFRTASDIIEYPSAAIPDVAQLIEDLQYAIDSFPSDLSGLLMAIAPSFNKNTAYSAGDYVWYYGGFYKFTVDHPAGNWNPGHVVDVHLADDVADLSGAVDGIDATIGNTPMGTTATTITGAIAEHETDIGGITTQIGSTPMGTTATTITGAIKEHSDSLGDLKSAFDSVTTLTKSRNIWNETTRNGYYNTSGVFVSNSSYLATYMIEVEPSTDYYWYATGNRGRMCFYSGSTEDTFLSSLSGVNAITFTTASNCHYIAFDMAGAYGNTYKGDICVNVSDTKNGTYSAYFVPYYTVAADKTQYLNDIADWYNNNAVTVYGTNRFDPDAVVVGNLDHGAIVATNTGWRTTGFIYVRDVQTVYFSADYEGGSRGTLPLYFVSIYDKDQVYIDQPVATSTSSPYTIPSTAYWIRFSYQYDSTAQDYMLETNRVLFSPAYKTYSEKTVISPYSGYKWAVVGDSLTEGNSRATMNYQDYIKDKFGLTVYNYGLSGTGYKRTYDENKAFYQRISGIDTSVNVVTIFGGGNDMQYVADELGDATDTGTTTLCGCINTTIDNLLEIMPTVQIGIITPTPWKDYNPSNTTNPMSLYAEKIVEICKLRGIPCLDLYHCSNLRPWDSTFRGLAYAYDGDNGVHPSDVGQRMIASHIEEFIKTLLV